MKRRSHSTRARSLFDPPRLSWSALPLSQRTEAVEQIALLLVQMFVHVRSSEEVQEHERQD